MKNIKYIIIAIIAVLAIIAIVLVILLFTNKGKNINNSQESTDGDVGEEIVISNEEEIVTQISNFKTVENCIQQYYDLLSNDSETYLYRDENGGFAQLSNTEINSIRMQLLSKSYLTNNNLNSSNLSNVIKPIDVNTKVFAMKMKVLIGEEIEKYAVHAIVLTTNNELIDETNFFVILDRKNKTFAIEPINNKNIEFNNIKISNTDTSIEANDNNGYANIVFGYEEEAKDYLERFKCISIAKTEEAYNSLDEEYRNARFGSYNNFKQYVEKNKNFISKIYAAEYLVNHEKGYTEYVIKDQFGNYYIFDEKAIFDYTVKLDTYTLENEKFTKTYKSATNKEKVLMNLDKFFQMLNANDYTSSYAVLDENFKAKYFKTEESFESFVKQYMYPHANTNYMNYSDSISGVYTYYVELTNKENKNDKEVGMNIVMQFLEETNYKISFEIIK